MGLILRDWNGHPLDKGFYKHTRKETLHFIRRQGEKYFISSIDEPERELNGTPDQHFMMLRACPHEYLEKIYQDARRVQEFIASKNESDSD